LARIRDLAMSLHARERVVEEAMRQLTVDAGRVEHELSTARTRLVTVNREINNLVGVIAQGGLNSVGTIKDALDERTAEKGVLERRIEELSTQLTPAQEVNDAARQFLERWGQVGSLLDAANPTERRLILQHLIEVVELRSSGVGGGWGWRHLRDKAVHPAAGTGAGRSRGRFRQGRRRKRRRPGVNRAIVGSHGG
jgi:chromosome segregation ATPase